MDNWVENEDNWVEKEIKDEYKDWRQGQKIFISSPTGTGKTTFILNKLLPYYADQGKKILILVNRRILRGQLNTKLQEYEDCNYITVKTYQSLERIVCEYGDKNIWNDTYITLPNNWSSMNSDLRKNYIQYCCMMRYRNQIDSYIESMKKILKKIYKDFDCIVCDECHYFLMDSNFNTNTYLSYHLIQEIFFDKLQIYMSATIEPIKNYIENENHLGLESTFLYGYKSVRLIQNQCKCKYMRISPKEYQVEKNYNYVDVNILDGEQDLIDTITNKQSDSKWLIFVDSIKKGKKLQEKIKQEMRNKAGKYIDDFSVTYIDADYENNEESIRAVGEIVQKEKFQEKVLISTSVMDNGINIADKELRNLVIMVDTETEFIQMLGRKRKDGNVVKLFILIRDQAHFIKRRNNLKRLIKIYTEYMKSFVDRVESPLKKDNRQMQQGNYENLMNGNIIDRYNCIEKEVALERHCELMRKLAEHTYRYEDVSKLFYVYQGTFLLNKLSAQNLLNLSSYYDSMIKKFGTSPETIDKYAFIREQMHWLGKTDFEAEMIIEEFAKSEWDKAWKCIDDVLKGLVEKNMSVDENKEWKNDNGEFQKSLIILMNEVENRKTIDDGDKSKIKTIVGVATKTSNALTKPCVDFLRKYCDLPYGLEVKAGIYTYYKVHDEAGA
ncbi:MAG: DEAD/DEAH box helicase family protein [Clostridiales bacterium]|nr:DEAD/DEAH box helicase family protein [Clostridiales bacterium]